MNRSRVKWTSLLCAGLGLLCLVAAALRCADLERGSVGDKLFVAAGLIVLAALAMVLLWREKVPANTLLIMLLPVGAAMLIRTLCLDYASYDYLDFLTRWYHFFQENGGFSAFKQAIGDYNVPYLYFMAAISYFRVPDLYLIKLFSLIFDVLLAWGGFRLVRILCGETGEDVTPVIAFSVLLFLPTVVLNGAYWGQCDSLYGALSVLALGQLLSGKNKSSVILLAVAFSFKLQTIFLIPLWGVLWFARKIKFRELLLFPLAYVITILPAMLLGKPLMDILGVYVGQIGEYSRLTLNAPSVYQLIPYGMEVNETAFSKAGIVVAALLVALLLVVGLRLGKNLRKETVMAAAIVLVIGLPFFLPHMHERYFFLADVLTICWAFGSWRRLPVPVLVCGSSLASYCVYLRLKYNCIVHVSGYFFTMGLEALAMLAALIFSLIALMLSIAKERRK